MPAYPQGLLDNPSRFHALVLSPTRELALQIKEQIEALGAGVAVKCAALVGGIDMVSQVLSSLCSLAKVLHLLTCSSVHAVTAMMLVPQGHSAGAGAARSYRAPLLQPASLCRESVAACCPATR